MIRRGLLFVFCLFVYLTSNAQTAIYSENFDGCSLPTGWSNTSNTGAVWSFGNNGGTNNLNGSCMAYYDDDQAGSGAAAVIMDLVSPVYDMSGQPTASLQFLYNYNDFTTEFFKVDVWDKATQAWVNLLTESGADNCGTWGCNPYPFFNQDITPYLSDSLQLRFQYDDNGGNWGWYVGVDDVAIVFYPPDDVGATAVVSPVDGCGLDANTSISAEIKNYGSATADTIELSLWADGVFIATEMSYDTITPFGLDTFTFSATANLAAAGAHEVRVSARSLAVDAFHGNDTVTATVTKTLIDAYPYVQTFDNFTVCSDFCTDGGCASAFTEPGWKNILDGSDDWDVGTTGSATSFGTGPPSDHTSGAGNYLFTETSGCNNNTVMFETPCFDFTNLPDPGVSFWYHMEGAAMGTLSLEISSGGGPWTSLWSLTGAQGSQWNEVVIDTLGISYAGQIVQFRFVGLTGGTFTSDMAVDDFSVRSYSPNNASPTALIAPGDDCGLTNAETVVIEVSNFGPLDIDSVSMELYVDGSLVASEVKSTVTTGSSSDNYSFMATADFSGYGPHDVMVVASALSGSGDAFPGDDTLRTQVINEVIFQFPYLEDFDSWNGNCVSCTDGGCATNVTSSGWVNAAGDTDDWDILSGSTGSFGTGPTEDHTSGNGQYIYTETSGCNNTTAFMDLPCFDFSSMQTPGVSFWYHMWGAGTGTISFEADTGTGWTPIWTLSGDQGDEWKEAVVDLTPYKNVLTTFRFNALTGPQLTSDMAIDDVEFRNFFSDAGALEVVEPSSGCGLTSAESVKVAVKNYSFNATDTVTLDLWVDGSFVGTELMTTPITSLDTLHYTFGSTVDLSASGAHNITVIGKLKNGDTNITNDTTTIDVVNSVFNTYPYLETFDTWTVCSDNCTDGNCFTQVDPLSGWENSTGDDDDWDINTGSTSSFNTGPTSDHTSGSGVYLYTETSGCNNTTAIVTSPCFDLTPLNAPGAFFWYHMQGGDMGTLTLEIDAGSGWTPIWSKSGDQGAAWTQGKAALTSYLNQSVQFRFIANTGSGFTSDMAIDDFSIDELVGDDVAAMAILQPTSLGACQALTANETVVVELSNQGANPISNFGLTLQLDGTPIVTDTFTATIPLGGTATHSFSVPVDLSNIAAYNISVNAGLAGDTDINNDATFSVVTNLGAPITTYPYTQNFDSWATCGFFGGGCTDGDCGLPVSDAWINPLGDGDDWDVFSGSTGSFATGPTTDHTTGIGNYMYVETSCGNNGNSTFLETPCFDFSTINTPEVVFWYHMWGGDMGTVMLQADSTGTGQWDTLWTKAGDQGDAWIEAKTSLFGWENKIVKFRFVSIAGNGFGSDMAIDDFKVRELPLKDAGIVEIVTPSTSGTCNAYSNAETVTVKYANLGANPISSVDLSLWVNNTLLVVDNVSQTIQPEDTLTHTFSVTADLSAADVYNFTTSASNVTLGDDDVSNDSMRTIVVNDIITAFPYSENFDAWGTCLSPCDDGSCADTVLYTKSLGWVNQEDIDDSDWSIWYGATPNANTGPGSDHTSGTGNYIYADGGNFCANDDMIIETPCFDFDTLYAPRVSFWYHMRGNDMGTLRLEADSTGTGNWTTVWSLSGNQGGNWLQAEVDVWDYAGTTTKFRFWGTTGNQFFDNESDMGVDDFMIIDILPDDLEITEVRGLEDGCGSEFLYADIDITNIGSQAQNDYTVSVNMVGTTNQTIDSTLTLVLAPEQTVTVSIGPFNTSAGGNYTFTSDVTINNAADFDNTNNSDVKSILTTKLSTAFADNDTICGPGSVDLMVSGDATEYFWYNSQVGGTYVHNGTTFTTPVVDSTTTFWVEGRNPVSGTTGLLDTLNAPQAAGYNDYYPDGLKFNALFDVEILEVTLYPIVKDPTLPTTMVVNLEDATGMVINTLSIPFYGSVGDTTIALNFSVPKGNNYALTSTGSSNVEYYRMKGGIQYPFILPYGIRITGAVNNLPGYYYNFFNWKVNYLGCPSPENRLPVTLGVVESNMTLDFQQTVSTNSTTANGTASVTPQNGTAPFTYAWDANTGNQTTATATGLLCGTYTVTVTDKYGCSMTGEVQVGCSVGTEDIPSLKTWAMSPNPTNSDVRVTVELDNNEEVQIEIFNVLGQKVFETTPESVAQKVYEFDFSEKAAGVYQVRLRVGEKYITKQLVVTDN